MGFIVDGQNYAKRVKLTYDSGSFLSGNVTDAPVVLLLTSAQTGVWTWATADSDGDKCRITTSDGTTLLKYEVVSFNNSAETAQYELGDPTLLSSGDTIAYYYYDADTPSSGEDIPNTWNANCIKAYHFDEDKAAGYLDDSTGGADATEGAGSATVSVSGMVGKGRTSDNVNDYIDSPMSDITTAGTIEISFSNLAKVTGAEVVWSLTDDSADTNSDRFLRYNTTSGKLGFTMDGSTFDLDVTPAFDIGDSTRRHYVVKWSSASNNVELFIGGVSVASTTYSSAALNINEWLISAHRTNSGPGNFAGMNFDEATASDIERSDDWVIARYQSQLGTWLTIGAEETGAIAATVGVLINGGLVDRPLTTGRLV